VELELTGAVRDDGMILDFAVVKQVWRKYLDENFDHHTVVNDADPMVAYNIAGVQGLPFDPTVENMAMLWGCWVQNRFSRNYDYYVKVWEASTNAATWRSDVTSE
jgi:6-pyruvoyl-tetrahydropterin synthase